MWLESLAKSFGATQVTPRLDPTIAAGALCMLIGPLGCGKSTLLRMIVGLEDPSSGRLRIGGHDVTRDDHGRRRVAMAFQSYALHPHMTMRQNMVSWLPDF